VYSNNILVPLVIDFCYMSTFILRTNFQEKSNQNTGKMIYTIIVIMRLYYHITSDLLSMRVGDLDVFRMASEGVTIMRKGGNFMVLNKKC